MNMPVTSVPREEFACLEDVEREVLAAKSHLGGLITRPLFRLDPAWFSAIQADVSALLGTQPGSNVADPAHPTHWVNPWGQARQFSLFNQTGETADFLKDFNSQTEGKRFWHEDLPSLGRLVNAFAPALVNFRLNELSPGSGLHPHEEPVASARGAILRFHIPVFTNPSAEMVLEQRKYHFEPGVLYFFNKGCVHAAINNGTAPRHHFVFDMPLTPWVYEMLFGPGATGPCEGFLHLTAEERERLSASVPFPVTEYREGCASGEVILMAKADESGDGYRRSKRINADIPCPEAISMAQGWWGMETWEGMQFRWAGPEAMLELEAVADGAVTLTFELEPGPSAALGGFDLIATDHDGAEYGRARIERRGQYSFPVSVHRGRNRVRLQTEGASSEIAGDSRTLSYRVFGVQAS